MEIPFTVAQFFDLFGTYNTAIWPLQIVAYLLGILALFLAFRPGGTSARIICGVLALFWIGIGAVYHMIHFSRINPAAMIFGIFFIIQGALFFVTGVIAGKMGFRFTVKPLPLIGALFILYAMAIYPALGAAFGHLYPRAPMFGVAPCPATIFTFGILLWTSDRVPGYLLVIPLLWSLVGMSAAINLRVPQDYGLAVAGLLGTGLLLMQNRRAVLQGKA